MLALATMIVSASACKRDEPAEPASVGESQGAAGPEEQAANENEATAPSTGDEPAAADQLPAAAERSIKALQVPGDWVEVKVQTPKGVNVSMGVPGDWVELRPPNEATLAVRMAPADAPAAGTKATVVATKFEGGRAQLAAYTRERLSGFAAIKGEGPLRVGTTHGYELVASWTTPVGAKDTVQLIVATGKEAIGVSCELPPGKLDTLMGLCDEIFATVTIEGATAKE
ncbi:MAG: hypothetical protein AMJ62_15580 [Myxococcales bacterium SG8_38]|nr:MAG: hypothetical protein AMJ62_15580 [Myxococcales bacterium SG8_38]